MDGFQSSTWFQLTTNLLSFWPKCRLCVIKVHKCYLWCISKRPLNSVLHRSSFKDQCITSLKSQQIKIKSSFRVENRPNNIDDSSSTTQVLVQSDAPLVQILSDAAHLVFCWNCHLFRLCIIHNSEKYSLLWATV